MRGSRVGRFGVAVVLAVLGAAGMTSVASAADGDLFIDGCVTRGRGPPCATAVTGLPVGVAASPDGKQLYVGTIATGPGSFTGLQIYNTNAPVGVATPRPGAANCFAATLSGAPCTLLPALIGVDNPIDAQVSPDGRNVYLVSYGRAVFNFIRNPETGDLSYANCVGLGRADGAHRGCHGIQHDSQPGQPERLRARPPSAWRSWTARTG